MVVCRDIVWMWILLTFPSRNFHELIVVHCDTTSHDEERSWIFDVDPNDAHEYFKGSKLSYTTLIISINHYQSFACAEPFSTMMIPNYHIKKMKKTKEIFIKLFWLSFFQSFLFMIVQTLFRHRCCWCCEVVGRSREVEEEKKIKTDLILNASKRLWKRGLKQIFWNFIPFILTFSEISFWQFRLVLGISSHNHRTNLCVRWEDFWFFLPLSYSSSWSHVLEAGTVEPSPIVKLFNAHVVFLRGLNFIGYTNVRRFWLLRGCKFMLRDKRRIYLIYEKIFSALGRNFSFMKSSSASWITNMSGISWALIKSLFV